MTENLRSIQQFAAENPAFTESALRWHVFKSRENGLDKWGGVVRLGRRVFIDRAKFAQWLGDQQGQVRVGAK